MATQDLPLRLPSCRQAVAALQANTAVQKALSQIKAQAGRRIEEQIALRLPRLPKKNAPGFLSRCLKKPDCRTSILTPSAMSSDA